MSNFTPDFKKDWSSNNLSVIRQILLQAYALARRTMQECSPVAENPNRPYAQGNLRWVLIDALLQQACREGRLEGIEAHFQPNKSGPLSLELLGDQTRTLIVHLSNPEESPPDSDLRKQARDWNQTSFAFMQESVEKERIQLLLVHSGEKFAALRAYYGNERPSVYHQITGNIMEEKLPVAAFETEEVEMAEPELTVLPDTETRVAAAS